MWILILLICSLPGALWAKKEITGIVGRSITIDCHYGVWYRSHVKYWCRGWFRWCDIVAATNRQNGRISITDDKRQGVFVVTMKDLRSGDAGKYSCGIETSGRNQMYKVKLQISDEPVSVPVLRFLTPLYVSLPGGSVSVSCESVQGSLPIQYTWYEKTPSEDSKISDTNKLDLHCQSFKQQHHQYYCTASNHQGEKSSEMVTVSVINRSGENCSYEIQNRRRGALWAERKVRGIVGSAITIDCHYDVWYRSHVKYWCRGWTRQCDVVAATNRQNGRISITENKTQGVFVVTMKDLRSGDAGWYSCGIEELGLNPIYNVKLQISNGALWAEREVRGIVGRSITIDCHYGAEYRSNVKYWCRGWTRQCDVVATTNRQNGRISITENKTQGVFVVTMKDLRSGDAGWYSCGIEELGLNPMYHVKLQISNEPVSVPELRFLSPPNASCSGGSVSVSCESVQGSLPIQYSWYEKTPSEDSKISDTNKLDLHCQSFKQQHHQYYCTASNNQGEKPSEMVNVSAINRSEKDCSYVTQISSVGAEYTCEVLTTKSPTTSTTSSGSTPVSESLLSSFIWNVIRWGLFTLLVICVISATWYTRKSQSLNESDSHSSNKVGN
ncbi:polymeric immunoglobulin receptor-like [Mustelus asterias]